MAMNLAAWHRGLTQIVVVGPPDRDDTRALQRVVADTYLPASLVLPVDPASAAARARSPRPCRGSLRSPSCATAPPPPMSVAPFTCEQPVTTPAALAALLRE